MNRLSFYLFVLALGAWGFSSCGSGDSPAATPSAGERLPNIIYILADDLGYGDLSCYGQQHYKTPNIDRLAAEGMRFTQHYSGSTVCAPSRSALLTGQHTGHTFVRGNYEIMPEGQYPLPDSVLTLPEVMQQAGYVTGAFGKWGLGYPGSEGDPTAQGFDTFFGYNCQRIGHHYYPHYLWSDRDSVVLSGNAGQHTGEYGPAIIHGKTLQFIREHQSEPFFLFVPSIIPHAELAAPDSLIEKYRSLLPPGEPYEGYDEGPDYRRGPYGSQAHPRAAFAAMMEVLDHQVGEIIATLEELNLTENTLIIFTSDNGPHREGGADPDFFDSNGPLRGYKRDLYEGGIRVPMIARWPGKVQAGATAGHVSAFWDLMPTVAELAGTKAPEGIDGVSFLPTLLGQEVQPRHDYLYWEFHEKGGRVAVRKDNWKGVKYGVLEDPDTPLELYNLADDVGETSDLAAQYPDVVAALEDILRKARTPSAVFNFGQGTYLNSH